MEAVLKGHTAIVQQLIAAGANVNAAAKVSGWVAGGKG